MTVTVDLHNHVIPDFYWEASNEGGKAAGGITPPPWSLEGMVAYMDEARIDLTVPSISTPRDYPAAPSRPLAPLLYSNTLARFPEIKFIFSHGGGTVPYLAPRFGVVDAMGVVPGAEERGTAAEAFKRVYWDTAIAWGDNTLCT